MKRFLLAAVVLAVAAGAVWAYAETLGMQSAWPFLIGLALIPLMKSRAGLHRVALGALIGVTFGWAIFAVVSYALPLVAISFGITAAAALALIAVLGAALPRHLSWPAMVTGAAVYIGTYEPIWIANRGGFAAEGVAAAAVVLLGLAAGMLVATVTAALAWAGAGAPAVSRAAAPVVSLDERRQAKAECRRTPGVSPTGFERRLTPERRRSKVDLRLAAAGMGGQ